MVRPLRLGVVNETLLSGRAWVDHVRRIEAAGVDIFLVRDHLSRDALGPQWAPFSALATAAASTTDLRIGTMVLANDFRHPAVVAQEAATLADLSENRFELGMGAGWFAPEFRAAGLPFDEPATRIARLQESVQIVKSLLEGETVKASGTYYRVEGLSLASRPGKPPPILIGAGGRKMLAFAARSADIVGILPAPIRRSDDDEKPSDRSSEAFVRKVEVLRAAAGPERFGRLELCAFATIRVTDRRQQATEQLIEERGWAGISPEDVWGMPTVFVGSPDGVRDLLLERRERFGLSYVVSTDRDLVAIAQVIARL